MNCQSQVYYCSFLTTQSKKLLVLSQQIQLLKKEKMNGIPQNLRQNNVQTMYALFPFSILFEMKFLQNSFLQLKLRSSRTDEELKRAAQKMEAIEYEAAKGSVN